MGLAWLDLLAVDRIGAMREFLTGWYPETRTGTVVPAAPSVPAALAELYAVAAGRPAVLGTQNAVYTPDALRTDPHEGLLVFAAENQGNFVWMIDPAEDDPVVWLVPDRAAALPEREPLSGFLLQFCLFEALLTGQALAGSSMLTFEQTRQVTASLREVPLAPWRWPCDPTRFFVAPDLVLYAGTCVDHVEVMVSARTAAALAEVTKGDVPWDVYYE